MISTAQLYIYSEEYIVRKTKNVLFETLFEAVLFDLDGTLYDTLPLHFKAYNQTLRDLHIKLLSWEEFIEMSIFSGKKVIDFIQYRYPDTDTKLFYEIKNHYYQKLVEQGLKLRVGVDEFVNSLRSNNLPFAIVTSGRKKSLDLVFTKSWPCPFPDVFVTNDHVHKTKPSPAPYLFAIEKLNRNPARCVVFEDSIAGVYSAKEAGTVCIQISTPLTEHKKNENADFLLSSFEQLKIIVKSVVEP